MGVRIVFLGVLGFFFFLEGGFFISGVLTSIKASLMKPLCSALAVLGKPLGGCGPQVHDVANAVHRKDIHERVPTSSACSSVM